jgi:hypothetical protein
MPIMGAHHDRRNVRGGFRRPGRSHAKIDAARAGLLAAGGEGSENFRAAMARLERIEAELKRVEAVVANVSVPV